MDLWTHSPILKRLAFQECQLIPLPICRRHRYEVNPDFVSRFEAAGLKFVGQDEKNVRMEVRLKRTFLTTSRLQNPILISQISTYVSVSRYILLISKFNLGVLLTTNIIFRRPIQSDSRIAFQSLIDTGLSTPRKKGLFCQ